MFRLDRSGSKKLNEYELKKVLEALFHAERNAHPTNRREWKRLYDVVESKLGTNK